MKKLKMNVVDKAVSFFSPQSGLKRIHARHRLSMVSDDSGYMTSKSTSKRELNGMVSEGKSPTADTIPKLQEARDDSRDLFMNTSLASSAFRRARTNIAGSGLKFQSRIDYKKLGMTVEEAEEWQYNLELEFETWATSKHSDLTGQINFYENQALMVMSQFMNGDAFFMLPWQKPHNSGNWPYELRIKTIEADLIRNPAGYDFENTLLSTKIVGSYPGGVEKNSNGEVVAFHVANYYPNQYYLPEETEKEPAFQRIPIRSESGRTNIYQLVEFDRIGQTRGMPWITNVVGEIKQLTRLSKNVVMKAVVSAMYTVFIKDMSGLGATMQEGYTPEETLGGGGGYGPDKDQESKEIEDSWDLEMGYGNILYLDDDKEITVADPKGTDKDFEAFYNASVAQIGASLEIPLEQYLLKFQSSYSAARAALLEAWKFWKKKREWLGNGFCQPVLEAFIEEMVIKNRISAPGYLDDPVIRAAWSRGAWIGAGNGQIDPLKETRAAVMRIDNNLSSYEDEYRADKGGKWDSMVDRKSVEHKKLKNLELVEEIEAPPQSN